MSRASVPLNRQDRAKDSLAPSDWARLSRGLKGDIMARLAIVAAIKTVPGGRDDYLKNLRAHAERGRATEPGRLQFAYCSVVG